MKIESPCQSKPRRGINCYKLLDFCAVVAAQVFPLRTTDREVPSSFLTGSRAFSSLLFPISINQWCALKQVHHGGATPLIFNFPTTKVKAKLGSLRRSKLNLHGMIKKSLNRILD